MDQPVIYNVTTAVMPGIEDQWLTWMQDIHIPEVLGTGCFFRHQLVKLLDTGEQEHATYAVQYYAHDKRLYDDYLSNYAKGLRKEVKDKWGEMAMSFSTLMLVVA
jgi:hypothetical protein